MSLERLRTSGDIQKERSLRAPAVDLEVREMIQDAVARLLDQTTKDCDEIVPSVRIKNYGREPVRDGIIPVIHAAERVYRELPYWAVKNDVRAKDVPSLGRLDSLTVLDRILGGSVDALFLGALVPLNKTDRCIFQVFLSTVPATNRLRLSLCRVQPLPKGFKDPAVLDALCSGDVRELSSNGQHVEDATHLMWHLDEETTVERSRLHTVSGSLFSSEHERGFDIHRLLCIPDAPPISPDFESLVESVRTCVQKIVDERKGKGRQKEMSA